MPDSSDSSTPRPGIAAAPVPIARADASSRAQRIARAAGSTARDAASAVKYHALPHYTLGEEIANSVTHGIGAALSIAALVIMIVKAVVAGQHPASLACALVFGITLILEYLASTLYHAIAPQAAKRVFRVIDHCGIYVLIAGGYTPFCLITLANDGGPALFFAVWAIAIIGIALECFMRERQPHWVCGLVYLLMGWLAVFKLPELVALLNPVALALLAVGGVCYTVGVPFYIAKNVRYLHSVFHLWVLAGSIFQFMAVILFVI